jgi:hypothetical protein
MLKEASMLERPEDEVGMHGRIIPKPQTCGLLLASNRGQDTRK